MLATELRRVIEKTADEWEPRKYLGMSLIGQCPLKLYRDLTVGRRRPDWVGRRLMHEGYVHQRDVVARLEQAGVKVANQERELMAPFGDGMFQGHIDGEIEGDLLEIKSVSPHAFERVRRQGARPKDAEQVQAYMHVGGYKRALIVYKERETGDIWVIEVMRDLAEGQRLEEKGRAILEAVERGEAPECECGRCRRR